MRNVLSELPILLCCVWGGLAAGLSAALLRLPRKLYTRSLRGRHSKALPRLLFTALDILSALLAAACFSITLLYANGGELRLYAVSGFAAAAYIASRAVKGLIM